MRTAKHNTMRSVNTSILLKCLQRGGPMTRNELQNKSGLSWGSVSNIVADLLSLEILSEWPISSSNSGRKPLVVDINRRVNLCVGVDIHMQGISCVITDLGGAQIVSLHKSIAGASRQDVLDRAVNIVRDAIAEAEVERTALLGIGLSVQGSVDREKGISIHSAHLPDWDNVPIRQFFEDAFSLPVILMHDAQAMSVAAIWNNEYHVHNLAFIRLDMGIGMAMVFNDQIYSEGKGNTNEFGHIIINPDGPPCTCGNRGCLEAYASGRSILRRAREGGTNCKLSPAGDFNESVKDLSLLARAAQGGAEFEAGLFQEMGKYLGIGIANLINMMDPDLVLLGGVLARYADLFLENTLSVARQNVCNANPVRVVTSSLDSDGAAIGASLVLLEMVMTGKSDSPLRELLGLLNTTKG